PTRQPGHLPARHQLRKAKGSTDSAGGPSRKIEVSGLVGADEDKEVGLADSLDARIADRVVVVLPTAAGCRADGRARVEAAVARVPELVLRIGVGSGDEIENLTRRDVQAQLAP
ncbi:hypothetical protein, partial [Streptomyces sp. SAS_276]|uniref:hypothetical protein n=1 Tax=Streptomyces sp. SAS_276 TaxID=3412745 RepID=UPI00403D329A